MTRFEKAVGIAIDQLEALCSDYRFGKPSEADVAHNALLAADAAYDETGLQLAIVFDEYGNPEFTA